MIDLNNKFQNAPIPYPTMLHSEQKWSHSCSECSIVGYGTGAFWDLWNWTLQTPLNNVSANSNITVPYRGDFRKNGQLYLYSKHMSAPRILTPIPCTVTSTVNPCKPAKVCLLNCQSTKTRQPLSKITLLIMILMCFVWLKLGLVQTAEIELLKKT